MQSQFIGEKQGDLLEQKCVKQKMLCIQDIAFKFKISWYLAKQMTNVSNRNSNQFHHGHERSKDIEISSISI